MRAESGKYKWAADSQTCSNRILWLATLLIGSDPGPFSEMPNARNVRFGRGFNCSMQHAEGG
jgi:hypothetical protein